MRNFLFSVAFVLALFGAGCATTGVSTATLLSPAQIQIDLSVAGSLVAPRVSSSAKALVHTFAVALLALSTSTLTAAGIAAIVPVNVPVQDQALVNGLVDAGVTALTLAVAKWGEHNATTLAYAQAVGNGILAAGF